MIKPALRPAPHRINHCDKRGGRSSTKNGRIRGNGTLFADLLRRTDRVHFAYAQAADELGKLLGLSDGRVLRVYGPDWPGSIPQETRQGEFADPETAITR